MRNRRPIHTEDGSVYLLSILVLLILTIVGLALAITTQSEMQIGANEEMARRTFYSANGGPSLRRRPSTPARSASTDATSCRASST